MSKLLRFCTVVEMLCLLFLIVLFNKVNSSPEPPFEVLAFLVFGIIISGVITIHFVWSVHTSNL